MAFNKEKAEAFLNSSFNKEKAEAFLNSEQTEQTIGSGVVNQGVTDPNEFLNRIAERQNGFDPETTAKLQAYEESQQQKSLIDYANEYAGSFNSAAAGVVGLPGDIFNYAADKLGADTRVYDTSTIRKLGSKAGVMYENIPDTPAAKAGEYSALGLTFLAPFIGSASKAMKAGSIVKEPATTAGRVVRTMGEPFVKSPKSALGMELAASSSSGVGAYYGKQEYGETGEIVGGILGGVGAFLTPMAAVKSGEYINKTLFPYTSRGGAIKATGKLKSLAETPNVTGQIDDTNKVILKNSGLSPAKKSGDKHLIALEKEVLKNNPELAHDFEMQTLRTNQLAKQELDDLGSDLPIEETQAFLKGRIERLFSLIDLKVEKSIDEAASSVANMKSATVSRKAANEIVRNKLKGALTAAREAEKAEWAKVDDSIKVSTRNMWDYYDSYITNKARLSDNNEMPDYVKKFLSRNKKTGLPVKGSIKEVETVKEVHAFYSRLGTDIAEESAKEAPDWSKVRVMGELRDSILEDMSGNGSRIDAAIDFSRNLNQKFKGGALDIIFGSKKTGGARTDPSLTLESTIGSGAKGAVAIKKILDATPNAHPEIEAYITSVMGRSTFINKDGRVNVSSAKKFMEVNKDILDIFPDLKAKAINAIELEEKALIVGNNAKGRLQRLTKSTANQIAGMKPGSVVNHILSMPNARAEMAKIYSQADARGRVALKGGIINHLMQKSKSSQVVDGEKLLSGQKLSELWKESQSVLGVPFSKKEKSRMNQIINTLIKNEYPDHLPSVAGALDPSPSKILSLALSTLGARAGARLGAGTSGASLKTASTVSKSVTSLLNKLDAEMSNKLITEAIGNEELFKALMTNIDHTPSFKKSYRIIQGWMIAHVLAEDSQ